MGGKRGFRILHREAEPSLVAEILDDAETILTRPAKAHGILRVDGHGQRFGTIVQTLPGLGHQAPHLTAGEDPAVFQRGLAPCLPLAEHVGVALVVVGGGAGAQEVGFHVARHGHVFELALGQHRNTRLTARSIELRHARLRRTGVRNPVQASVDVGSLGALPPYRFCRQEAARGNGDSLVVNRQRALQSGNALLRLL